MRKAAEWVLVVMLLACLALVYGQSGSGASGQRIVVYTPTDLKQAKNVDGGIYSLTHRNDLYTSEGPDTGTFQMKCADTYDFFAYKTLEYFHAPLPTEKEMDSSSADVPAYPMQPTGGVALYCIVTALAGNPNFYPEFNMTFVQNGLQYDLNEQQDDDPFHFLNGSTGVIHEGATVSLRIDLVPAKRPGVVTVVQGNDAMTIHLEPPLDKGVTFMSTF